MSQTPAVLVVNAGSSSLKLKLLPQDLSFTAERIGQGGTLRSSVDLPALERPLDTHEAALHVCLEVLGRHLSLSEIQAVGHRVVHGGERYTAPTLLSEAVLTDLEALSPLAPLHNPANLEGVRAALRLLPDAPHVAVFDTAFHSTLPPQAFLYALPRELYHSRSLRRYGFHGTSHDFVTRRAAELLGKPREALKLVSLHLGNGASAAAVDQGRSVDTTMGLTPLEGLVMGTRSGDVDPGLLLHLLREGMSVQELDTLLNKRSGLLGLSGVSNDMRDLRYAAQDGSPEAAEAVAVFCYRIRKTIGAYLAAMGGLDAVIFTGGIGENDAATRAQVLSGLEALGLVLDAQRNRAGENDISTPESPVRVLVIATDEERMIAEATLECVRAAR